jgi:hypothetical protein
VRRVWETVQNVQMGQPPDAQTQEAIRELTEAARANAH